MSTAPHLVETPEFVAERIRLALQHVPADKLWISPDDPTLVSVDEYTLRDSGINNPRQVRADAALLRAIVATGADLVLVEAGDVELEHGIGAVLRYADGATAAS